MSSRYRRRALIGAALACVACAVARAAEPPVELAGHPLPPSLDTITVTATREASLTAPDAQAARHALEHVPGGVDLVDAEEWRDTAARTLKDVLDYTPGVFVQPKWGEDARLSIRGSGLSRNFHLRGLQLLVDGMPMNFADGSADFQEIDPTAFAYTEVYKGANALRYGGNSLGGALHFVSPSGYDSGARVRADGGSFGMARAQLAAAHRVETFDGRITASRLEADGYRDHADGESTRVAANLGWRLAPLAETRLYLLGADIDQRIPGALTRELALSHPRRAAANNRALDYQRNMQSLRAASRTTLKVGAATLEFGGWIAEKQLIHPIFQYLDYEYHDRGGFLRTSLDAPIAEHANRLVFGVNLADGHIDNQQFRNLAGGRRGERLSASKDSAETLVVYAENQFDLQDRLTLIAGLQHVDAQRRRRDRFDDATDTSGRWDDAFTNPKLGLLWQARPGVQVFANLSRSAEAPSFGELNFTNAALSDTRPQRATTLEIGSRGTARAITWDLALYRAELRNEFQFFDLGGGAFAVTNADDTVHQGVEAGLDWTLARAWLDAGDTTALRLAYAFNDFFFDDDASWGRNELPGAPRHQLRAELRYGHASGLYLAPNLEWIPQGYDVDNANRVQTPDYALLGLRAGYDPGGRWSLYLDARNLGDREYVASASVAAVASAASALFEPGDGRAIYAGVNLELPW